MKYRLLIILSLFVFHSFGKKFVVINSNNAGAGSLRTAIDSCNNNTNTTDTINFNIPLSDPGFIPSYGIWIIHPTESLPSLISGDVLVDGTSQTVNQGNRNIYGPEIMLSGNNNTVETGISIINASRITIRGLIIGEFLYGIQLSGQNTTDNDIYGNFIGTNYDGTASAGNYNAIEILSGANNNYIGGYDSLSRNLIGGNLYAGIRISDANNNIVTGNFVGISRDGKSPLPNYDGITIEGYSHGNRIGGMDSGERNVCSGNVAYGIDIFGAGCFANEIEGNYLGTDCTGSYAVPNTYGILFDDRSNHNLVSGNLISGNTAFGAYFYNNGTNTNTLRGNLIGTNAEGISAIPNETGVHIDGASFGNIIDSNLISGNSANGITVFATYTDINIITRNRIGTDITGIQPLGNSEDGIRISQGPKYNLIGGTPLTANTIAFNGKNGVAVESDLSDYNRISCNSIYKNGNLGIDLYPEGITLNHPDNDGTGPNDNQNYPVILSKTMISPGQFYITGYLDSPSQTNQFLVEIYIADFNAAGIAQGKTYLGAIHPVTNGYWSDTLSFSATDSIIATATKPVTYPGNSPWLYGNTSEFTPMIRNNAYVETIPANHSFIYPNPAHAGESIHFYLSGNRKYSIEIKDPLGRVILQKTPVLNGFLELSKHRFNLGFYYCILSSDADLNPLVIKLLVLNP
ncbi:MAG: T9SS type A sorting domain-containing protein [Bacteroidales bacterium]